MPEIVRGVAGLRHDTKGGEAVLCCALGGGYNCCLESAIV